MDPPRVVREEELERQPSPDQYTLDSEDISDVEAVPNSQPQTETEFELRQDDEEEAAADRVSKPIVAQHDSDFELPPSGQQHDSDRETSDFSSNKDNVNAPPVRSKYFAHLAFKRKYDRDTDPSDID